MTSPPDGSSPRSDLNLLFAVLAHHGELITRTQFVDACALWAARKDRPLPEILLEQGWLTPQQKQRVDQLLATRLQAAGNDVHASLDGELTNDPDVQTVIKSHRAEPPRYVHVPLVSSDLDPEEVLLRYQLLTERPLQGGLGEVWKVRDQRLNRVVALKKLRPDRAHHAAAQAGFLHEAEVTAQLHHPNIVPVYDLFVPVARDKAFYTMPFLEGRTLADAVRAYHEARARPIARPPALRELLTVFVAVCQAVAYANHRGVIHRDLKGHNIMLGGPGEVFVVDWGLAKVLGFSDHLHHDPVLRSASDPDFLTRLGTRKGTPGFMAPEQAAGRVDLIDQRSDVYGLGAVLYEILTGQPPVDLSPEETRRLLGEETLPAKLSPEQILKVGEELLRKVEHEQVVPPSRHCPATPRALEAICLKALAKKREERYASAVALAEDVARWLADEPVVVYRDPWAVRLARLVRRHRTMAGAVTLVLLTALLGLGAGLWAVDRERAETARERDQKEQARQEAVQAAVAERQAKLAAELARAETVRERDQKEQARQEAVQAAVAERQAKLAAELAEKLAQKRLGYVQQANDILTSIFRDLNPRLEDHGGPPLLAQLAERLDQAAALLEGEAVGDAVTVARLQSDLAASLTGLGFPAKAIDLAGKATRTFEAQFGPDHADTLRGMNNLGVAYWAAGRPDQAVPLFEVTLAKKKVQLGPDHPSTLLSMHNLASAYQAAGRLDRALPLFLETLEKRQARLGADHPDTLASMSKLAAAYRADGQLDKAVRLEEKTLAGRQARLGADHAETLASMNDLALAYWAAGRLDKALPLLEEAFARLKAKLGPEHPDTLEAMNNLGTAYRSNGQLDKALPLLEETLAKRKARLGPDHPQTLTTMNDLALAYKTARQLGKAVALYEETWEKMKAKLGPDHPHTLRTMNNLALAYHLAGRLDEAVPLYHSALEKMQTNPGPDHPSTLTAMNNLAAAYNALGQLDKALPLYQETLHKRKARLGPDHPETLLTLNNLALALDQARRHGEAEPLLEEWITRQRTRLPADNELLADRLYLLGKARVLLQRFAEAEAPLRDSLAIYLKKRPKSLARYQTAGVLGAALAGQKKHAEAEPLLVDAAKFLLANAPSDRAALRAALQRVIDLYDAWDRPEDAALWRKQLEALRQPGL
jgi:serine/threonine protein kinase